MSYSLLVHAGQVGNGASGATTSGINTAGADLLVAVIANDASSPSAPTDSVGGNSNTWTQAVTTGTVSTSIVSIWYVQNPAHTGSGHTFSSHDTTTPIFAAAFSGSASSPLDQTNGGSSANSATQQTGSVTPSVNNELLIAAAATSGSGAPTIDSGFTITDSTGLVGGTSWGGLLSYLIQTTATAENPTVTSTGSPTLMAAVIATFKAAGGGALDISAIGMCVSA